MLFCIWFVNSLLNCFDFMENTEQVIKNLNAKPSCSIYKCYIILKSFLTSLRIFKMSIISFLSFSHFGNGSSL